MVSWRVGKDDFTPDMEFRVENEEGLVEETQFYNFNLQDYNVDPIPLLEGEVICFRAKNPTENEFTYIYSGYSHTYHSIPGQLPMFWTLYSGENQNCTDGDWGFFPGILYSGGEVNDKIDRNDG